MMVRKGSFQNFIYLSTYQECHVPVILRLERLYLRFQEEASIVIIKNIYYAQKVPLDTFTQPMPNLRNHRQIWSSLWLLWYKNSFLVGNIFMRM